MKVALVDDRHFSAYGAQRAMISLAAGLVERRWEPTIVTTAEGALADLARARGVPVRTVSVPPALDLYGGAALRLPWWRRASLLPSVVRYGAALDALFGRLEVDLVVANAIRPLLYSSVARARRRPVVWFLQGGEQFGALSYAAPVLATRIMMVTRGAAAAIPAPVRAYAERRSFVNSPGVDPAAHRRASVSERDAFGLPTDKLVVLVAGSVESRKGFDVAIEALRLALPRCPDLHLAIAGSARGDANQRYEQRLRNRAAHGELPVSFLGWVGDMPRLMASADVFVLSSRLERLGLVTLEAMASRVPVVVTRAGGSEETVVDGESGLVVPPEDPGAMAEALVRVGTDPALRRRLAAAGHQRVREHFTTSRFVDRFVEEARHLPRSSGRPGA